MILDVMKSVLLLVVIEAINNHFFWINEYLYPRPC